MQVSELFDAVLGDDLQAVKRYLENDKTDICVKVKYTIEEPSQLPFETTVVDRREVMITPLCVALLKGHWAIAECLINNGAWVDVPATRFNKDTIFTYGYPFLLVWQRISPPDKLFYWMLSKSIDYDKVYYDCLNSRSEVHLLSGRDYTNTTNLIRIIFWRGFDVSNLFKMPHPDQVTIPLFKGFLTHAKMISEQTARCKKNIFCRIKGNTIHHHIGMEMIELIDQKTPVSALELNKLPENFLLAVSAAGRRELSDLCFEFNTFVAADSVFDKRDPCGVQQFLDQDITQIIMQLYAINLDPKLRNRGHEHNPIVFLLAIILTSHANTFIPCQMSENVALLDTYRRSKCIEALEAYFSMSLETKLQLQHMITSERLQQTLIKRIDALEANKIPAELTEKKTIRSNRLFD